MLTSTIKPEDIDPEGVLMPGKYVMKGIEIVWPLIVRWCQTKGGWVPFSNAELLPFCKNHVTDDLYVGIGLMQLHEKGFLTKLGQFTYEVTEAFVQLLPRKQPPR
ncbi:hypothetical protein A2716_00795 [candidate division WWE3 bacterium RIFCSPHIGHO2_01_FULL_40_23]|uniref:Uncharacterized protein n=1 Tax=candidate division WWE3 bacterium RIFCSPLOWO2_01_FULL_41_18 TaxID=1802625 RepID=A0A1F4VEE8_UNCKA|nr:MAG: hypothetical protein A2716_00795 [candidate division WWE3 bacterium RIFCSPHIGHO2_01_FULL_40_23]OGC55529.1 MAG: hypothetical protein A3A78_01065 [candidate division WWE3 bacterium RIFCSPLOWO2_01_FULL_41_18]